MLSLSLSGKNSHTHKVCQMGGVRWDLKIHAHEAPHVMTHEWQVNCILHSVCLHSQFSARSSGKHISISFKQFLISCLFAKSPSFHSTRITVIGQFEVAWNSRLSINYPGRLWLEGVNRWVSPNLFQRNLPCAVALNGLCIYLVHWVALICG